MTFEKGRRYQSIRMKDVSFVVLEVIFQDLSDAVLNVNWFNNQWGPIDAVETIHIKPEFKYDYFNVIPTFEVQDEIAPQSQNHLQNEL